jgi:hypothetical protein
MPGDNLYIDLRKLRWNLLLDWPSGALERFHSTP